MRFMYPAGKPSIQGRCGMSRSEGRSRGVQVVAPTSAIWLSSRQTYSAVRSAFRVHEALTYPKVDTRFGTSE